MAERSTGINTRNADEWVATFSAAEQADGRTRVVQIVSLTSGKIDSVVGAADRTVSTNDSLNITTFSGNIIVGDNSYLACYVEHSVVTGSCNITPLLCDNQGQVVSTLPTKVSQVVLPTQSGSGNYLTPCLSWDIKGTGAWKIYPHVYNLSAGNTVDLRCYTF